MKKSRLIAYAGIASCLSASAVPAVAQQSVPEEELQQLKREIEAQRKLLEAQQRRIEQLELNAVRGRGVMAQAPATPATPTSAVATIPATATPILDRPSTDTGPQ